MKYFPGKIKYVGLLFLIILFVYSCKTDEFRLGDIKVKEDFRTEIISPVFQGQMEFRDFVNTDLASSAYKPTTHTIIKYSNGTSISIPTNSFFNPYTIIRSFPFLIEGSYELDPITLKFMVSNGSPFPLNLELRFYNKETPLKLGPSITPPAFIEGIVNDGGIQPEESTYEVLLNENQRLSFVNSNRVQFTTWFDRTNFIDENDTLNAHYPVDISILMQGEAKAKNE